MRPQPYAVLGHEQGHTAEVVGEESGQGGRATGGRVAEVDRAEAVVLVPVEGEGAQGTLQVCGHGEEIRYARLASRLPGAGRTTGALQGPYGGLGAERSHQSALVTGEFGEPVQSAGETVRLNAGRFPRALRRARCAH